MGCKKEAKTIFGGDALCLTHYAQVLSEKQYLNLMFKRTKLMKEQKAVNVDETLPFPDKEVLYKKYLKYLKKVYGDKRGRKSSNKL